MEPYYSNVCSVFTLKMYIILDVLFRDCLYDKDACYLIEIKFKNLLKNLSRIKFMVIGKFRKLVSG